MLYTAQSASLALLEAVVHLGKMPRTGYCMATIEIAEDIAPALDVNSLPAEWAKSPGPDELKRIGDKFISEKKSLVLPVPSAIMPEEHNYLINPGHTLFKTVKLKSLKRLSIDERIFKGMA